MTLGGRFELPSYESTGFPDLRLTGLGYPSFPFLIVWNYITVLWFPVLLHFSTKGTKGKMPVSIITMLYMIS